MDLGWKRLIPLSLGWMLIVAGFLLRPAYGFIMAAMVMMASIVLGRAFVLGQTRETGADAILPPVGQRPLPPEVLRSWSEREEE
jgi:hypothetical protein